MKKFIDNDINILKVEFINNFYNSIKKYLNQEKIIIGLSGGSSINDFYKSFFEVFKKLDDETKNKIYFCLLDERIVSFDNEQSNFLGLKKVFLDEMIQKKLIKQNQILLPDFDDSNYLEEYYKKVKRIDIGLLGVGPDGHTCSLFPNHELLENNSYKYLEILDSPKPPSKRITISKSMLQDIDETYVFFIGEGKRKAYIDFLNKQIEYNKCPIKLIENNRKVYLFSDLVYNY